MYENERNAVLQNNYVTDIGILVANFAVKKTFSVIKTRWLMRFR